MTLHAACAVRARCRSQRATIAARVPHSPLHLVRGTRTRRVIIADGCRRSCAVHGVDEDAWIPCRIA